MKKIYTLIILSIFLFTAWCSLNQKNDLNTNQEDIVITEQTDIEIENQIEESNYYENKMDKFSFELPKERTLKENELWFNAIVFTPEDDDIKENVWISVQNLQKFLSVQEYYEETIYQLKDTLIWFKEIKSEDITKWSLNWKTIKYEQTASGKTLLSQQTFLISPDNTVYSINYTATKETFEKFIKWVELILSSFKVK